MQHHSPVTPLTVVMLSMHTSALDQPGQGDAGGMNIYVRHSAQALAARGHRVKVFTRSTAPHQSTQRIPGFPDLEFIPVIAGPQEQIPKEGLDSLIDDFAQGVADNLKHLDTPVVFHSHYWLSGLAGLRLKKLFNAPLIHTMHTIGVVKNTNDPTASEPQRRIEAELKIAQNCDVMITNSLAEGEVLQKFSGRDAEDIRVITPGVDRDIFTPDGPKRWPGPDQEHHPRLLFAGRFQTHKGPQVIINALAHLKNTAPDIVPIVHFVGGQSGADEIDLPGLAQQRGVADQSSFSAPASPRKLASFMRAADVIVMPSFSETFGFVAAEAQSCGVPVIAHRVGGLPSVVEDGKTGVLLSTLEPEQWAATIADIANRPEVWEHRGTVARQHSARFSWDRMADDLQMLYSRVTLA